MQYSVDHGAASTNRLNVAEKDNKLFNATFRVDLSEQVSKLSVTNYHLGPCLLTFSKLDKIKIRCISQALSCIAYTNK